MCEKNLFATAPEPALKSMPDTEMNSSPAVSLLIQQITGSRQAAGGYIIELKRSIDPQRAHRSTVAQAHARCGQKMEPLIEIEVAKDIYRVQEQHTAQVVPDRIAQLEI